MNILVVGGGGREHAIVWKLHKDNRQDKLFCAPGNAGIAEIAQCVDIQINELDKLLEFALANDIQLTIVGSEEPLVLGIVDLFEASALKIFGPNKLCAEFENSKIFTKKFLMRHNIPTAKYYEYEDAKLAKDGLKNFSYPLVIKADGIAAGKGVIIAEDKETAIEAIGDIMVKKVFAQAGNKIVMEEFLSGIEASVLCFVDGEDIVPMVSAQDYKKIFDGDLGLNTGGMGACSPNPIFSPKIEKIIENKILLPIINGLKEEKIKYKGVLFIGLMIENDEPKVLEFNVRFGDPETQVVLPKLETPLVEIIDSVLNSNLKNQKFVWKQSKTLCVVLASKGYPEKYEKGAIIKGLNKLDDEITVFHSGTKNLGDKLVANGGRVLSLMASASSLDDARKKVYDNMSKISSKDFYYRKDIGM